MKLTEIRSHDAEHKQVEQLNRPLDSKSTAREVAEHCRTTKSKPHSFSKIVAEQQQEKQKLGNTSALILAYLSVMVRDHGEKFRGKSSVRINLDHIAAQYPYLGRSTVDEAIDRLKTFGACEIGDWNIAAGRPSYDRTRWYHVPKKWRDMAATDLRYFHPSLAALVGVPAAVIHYNFTHWIDQLRVKGQQEVFKLAPATLVKLQPFSKSTIKRAIQSLVDAGLIYPVPENQCLYAAKPLVSRSSEADVTSSKAELAHSKADKLMSKPDNNNSCSSIVVPLEESSKIRPSADSHERVASVDSDMKDSDIGSEQTEFLSPFETLVSTPSVDANISFPIIKDFAELHEVNRNNREILGDLLKDKNIEEAFISKAHHLTGLFFSTIGKEIADDLYDNAIEDELFVFLLPKYRAWFQSTKTDPTSAYFDIFYYGVFECVTGAFLYAQHKYTFPHPVISFIRVTYDYFLQLFGRAEKRRLKAIEEENMELQDEFASPDEDKEWRTDLSPTEKARVFKQGLYSRNKVGWICLEGERRTDQIVITKKAINSVEQIFELNPDTAPGDLLMVMDKCMDFHARYPDVPKKYRRDINWHSRMGHKLSMFCRHLPTILQETQLASVVPITRFTNQPQQEQVEVDESVTTG